MNQANSDGRFAVLFVDDEEKARKYFRLALSGDFPVLTAGGVAEALGVLEREADHIGVLITDQRMPGQQGVDLLKRAREDWPGIVRILTTAYSDLDDAIAAVNRGEILRYITKPWDVQALHAELRHAMDFFLLRHERDLLLGEKLSVRQRMLQGDRLRDLLVIAGGLVGLRHAPQAVAAWLRDLPRGVAGARATAAELELWGLAVAETRDLMALHRGLRTLEQRVGAGFPERVALAERLAAAGLPVAGDAPEVAVAPALFEQLIAILTRLTVLGAAEVSAVGGDIARVRVSGGEDPEALFRDGSAPYGDALLAAYLAAWHHGGSLTVQAAPQGLTLELALPVAPQQVRLAEPDTDWLERQFAQLENWD